MLRKVILSYFFLLVISTIVESVDYSYRRLDTWKLKNPTCGGFRQSPINIPKYVNDIYTGKVRPQFVNYDKHPEEMRLLHSGHSVKLLGKWKNNETPTFYGDGLYVYGNYTFQEMHFHWGSNDNFGSEHTFNGHSLKLEGHLVHMNSKYRSMEEAAKFEDGIVVVAHTYDISRNDDLAPLTASLKNIMKKDDVIKLHLSTLDDLNVCLTHDYYSYKGSLTTPPCSESVTWFINPHVLGISNRTLQAFRNIQLTENDDNNVRPVQPLNKRPIYKFHNTVKYGLTKFF